MYVDPSAILAILLEEAEAPGFRERLASASDRLISVVGKVEAALSLGQKIENYEVARQSVSRFCDDARIAVLPVLPDVYDEVLKAYQRYGKGTGHPAKLNFGDCFSYAFAKLHEQPLLFKGEDFSKTDLKPA